MFALPMHEMIFSRRCSPKTTERQSNLTNLKTSNITSKLKNNNHDHHEIHSKRISFRPSTFYLWTSGGPRTSQSRGGARQ
mmetsp:Transcript_19883/g.48811  ORF Transcript_19883/g.48811 Transcript_19883/m.48811 type:complete len:80 (-) Transcript_19883:1092-1331(-)